jgi:hypothetical protein
LDTGVVTLYLSQNPPKEIISLFHAIKKGTYEAYILNYVLLQTFKHLCKKLGVDSTRTIINSFISQVPLVNIEITPDLITKAGILKCQHSEILSYIDCMLLAFGMNNKMPFHTTEKRLKKIPNHMIQKLTIVKYRF